MLLTTEITFSDHDSKDNIQIKNFRCVVIEYGLILGHISGAMVSSDHAPTTVFDLKYYPLTPKNHFHVKNIDTTKLQIVSGWGEVTHIYNLHQTAKNTVKNVSGELHAIKKPETATKSGKLTKSRCNTKALTAAA